MSSPPRGGRKAASRWPPRGWRWPRSPADWITRAGSTCCRTATCWWPRPTARRGRRTARGSRGGSSSCSRRRPGGAVPSPNRITLLRDADGDGVAETRSAFLAGLNSPFGMALVGDVLYVADTDAVVRFPYHAGRDADRGARRQGRRPAGGADQPSLDQERHRLRRRLEALRGRRLEQQRGGERHRGRGGARGDLGGGCRHRPSPRLRLRPAQSGRHGLGAREAAPCGRRSTNATSSAAISCPTT